MRSALSFTDHQLEVIMMAAQTLPHGDFLKLIAAQLKVGDIDVADATQRALRVLRNKAVDGIPCSGLSPDWPRR
jgi:hypothetical protein